MNADERRLNKTLYIFIIRRMASTIVLQSVVGHSAQTHICATSAYIL